MIPINSRFIGIGILSLAAASIMSALPAESNGQNPRWKGKIETIDGIKVVRNPAVPLYADVKYDLVQDLQRPGVGPVNLVDHHDDPQPLGQGLA